VSSKPGAGHSELRTERVRLIRKCRRRQPLDWSLASRNANLRECGQGRAKFAPQCGAVAISIPNRSRGHPAFPGADALGCCARGRRLNALNPPCSARQLPALKIPVTQPRSGGALYSRQFSLHRSRVPCGNVIFVFGQRWHAATAPPRLISSGKSSPLSLRRTPDSREPDPL
jgi:hypothetical protein